MKRKFAQISNRGFSTGNKFYSVGNGRASLQIQKGDITLFQGGAIVNAANSSLLGGGGVDGAIHRVAGPELLKHNKTLKRVAPNARCLPGEVVVTPGFLLRAKHIIHTVGPIYDPNLDQEHILRDAFLNSLRACEEYRLESVAFPAISCGVYRYPVDDVARVAIETIDSFRYFHLKQVFMVLDVQQISRKFVMQATHTLKVPSDIAR